MLGEHMVLEHDAGGGSTLQPQTLAGIGCPIPSPVRSTEFTLAPEHPNGMLPPVVGLGQGPAGLDNCQQLGFSIRRVAYRAQFCRQNPFEQDSLRDGEEP